MIQGREAEDGRNEIGRECEVGHGRVVIRQPQRTGWVAAEDGGDIGIDARMDQVDELRREGRRYDDVVECLRVAAKDIGILFGWRNELRHVDQVRLHQIGRRRHHLISRSRFAADGAHRIANPVVEAEGVVVANRDHRGAGVAHLDVLNQGGQELGLRFSLGPHADTGGRGLIDAVQRPEVVDDHRQLLRQRGCGPLHRGSQHQRRPVVQQVDAAIGRINERGVEADLLDRLHRNPAGGGLDQEPDIDAADIRAFFKIGHVLRIAGAGVGVHPRRNGAQHVEFLDFLDPDDVGHAEDTANNQRGLGQASLIRGRGQHDVAGARVVEGVEEAFHVERRHGVFGGRRSRGCRKGQPAHRFELGLRQDHIVAKRVVERPGHIRKDGTGRDIADGRAGDAVGIDAEQLGVAIPERQVAGAGVAGQRRRAGLEAGFAERPRMAGDHDVDFAEAR